MPGRTSVNADLFSIKLEAYLDMIGKLHAARRILSQSITSLCASRIGPGNTANWNAVALTCLNGLTRSFRAIEELGKGIEELGKGTDVQEIVQRAKMNIAPLAHLEETNFRTNRGSDISGTGLPENFRQLFTYERELEECLNLLGCRIRQILENGASGRPEETG